MITQWTDIMVDLETTDTNQTLAGIIQIAATFFNLKTGEIGPSFSRALSLPEEPNTGFYFMWSMQTLRWWNSNPDKKKILEELKENACDPRTVINDFVRWVRVNGTGKSLHFWSKPSHFDYSLLDKYFRYYGYENPFTYWKARDMRSYLLGLVFPEELPDLKLTSADAHNALADVNFQVNELIRLTKEKGKIQ